MIGFVGLSHLGVVSSVAAASKWFRVVAYDPRGAWISELNQGRLPFAEPGLDEALKSQRPRMQFTANLKDLAACDLVYFSVDIQTDEKNQSDASGLTELVRTTLPHLKAGTTLVVLSQVAPGFVRALSRTEGVKNFPLFYQVETLIFGQAWERAVKPERIIVGASDPGRELPEKYSEFLAPFGCPILKMRYESAELAKISINLCLAASLSVTNTLAEICESIGADWSEIIPALRMDKRIGPHAYLKPGLGISGGNLERDLVTVKQLSAERGTEAGIVEAFLTNSDYRRDWVLRLLSEKLLGESPNPLIAVWGLAYKPETNSVKNSPALALIKTLKGASLRVYDPKAVLPTGSDTRIKQVKTALEACQQADALVVMTPWEEFSKIKLTELRIPMRGYLVIDPWGALDASSGSAENFSYYRLGAPPLPAENLS